MKKTLLLFFIISCTFHSKAQSWCTSGSTWHYSLAYPANAYAKYTYLYDTVVGSISCNKIKIEVIGYNNVGWPMNDVNYVYTYSQNGIVFKNNGTLSNPQYDTLYNFSGAIGTKWRCQPVGIGGGPSCSQSYIEITGVGTIVIQGQTLNWRKIFYKNHYMYPGGWIESGTDTLFERIGTRHNMEFISGYYCADVTDVTPNSFRCFSDNQINLQMSAQACDFVTGIESFQTNDIKLEMNNPAADVLHLKLKDKLSGNKRIVLVDQFGKNISEYSLTEDELNINIEAFANGIYILQFYIGDQFTTRKLVIQK